LWNHHRNYLENERKMKGKNMKRFFALAAVFCFLRLSWEALAVEIPPITPADFADASPAAAWYWDFIAGSTGIAILSWIFRTVSAWLAARKAARWYEAANCVLVAVGSVAQTLVDALKKSRADGKLTEAEIREAGRQAREAAIAIGKAKGLGLIKILGESGITCLIEYFVGQGRAGAVAAPLSPPSPASPPSA
jgi:hypothetical protein